MDQGDPNFTTLMGDTPGTLGISDWGVPPTMGSNLMACSIFGRGDGGAAMSVGSKPSVSTLPTGSPSVTAAQLQAIFAQADEQTLDQVVTEVSSRPVGFGLDSRLRLAHFLAQVREEAGPGLKGKTENLNYRPDVLKSTFSYYKKHPEEADQDGRLTDPKTKKVTQAANQEVIANKAYGGRNGNGDVASGDGWKYRGRGFIQVTGRANYAALNKAYAALYLGDSCDFVIHPELLEAFPYTLRSAICFWVDHGLAQLADAGNSDDAVDKITAVVNLHTHSYAERRANFLIAYEAIK